MRTYMRRMMQAGVLGVALLHARMAAAGPIQTFTDLDNFLAAAGNVREIDFETLPDGTPSYRGADITPEFNYTEQGVTFSSHIPQLEIRGTAEDDFHLTTSNPTSWRNWIIADFAPSAWAVGIVFPGGTTLSAFDANQDLIGAVSNIGIPRPLPAFLGIVSPIPIAAATGDRGGETDLWYSFFFTPVPEPGTLALLLGALALLVARRP